MPSRITSIAILLFWVYASVGLFRRDILPDLWTTPPPDLRSIAAAEEDARPTHWELSIAEDQSLRNLRPIGQAVTESHRLPDGGTELTALVWFDSGGLKETKFRFSRDERVDIVNRMRIDASGNLRTILVSVRLASEPTELARFSGEVRGKFLVVGGSSRLLPDLNKTWEVPYEPRGMVQNAIGPFDRLPGLQVGQRWSTRVINPLTGAVSDVKVEVTGKHSIQWDGQLVPTLQVVQRMAPISARTWVRKDGLVLRQEVPLLFFGRLVLERKPDAPVR